MSCNVMVMSINNTLIKNGDINYFMKCSVGQGSYNQLKKVNGMPSRLVLANQRQHMYGGGYWPNTLRIPSVLAEESSRTAFRERFSNMGSLPSVHIQREI